MRRGLAPAVLALGLAGSQAGHLVAFQLGFGSAAQHLQSSGAHAHFPTLVKTTAGTIAMAFVAAIFVIGLARVLTQRSRVRSSFAPNYIELLAALFTIQLICFIAQEVGESLAAGMAVGSASDLLLWGTLGQLPVAAFVAAAVGCLWTRFESAVDDLREVLVVAEARVWPIAVALALWRVRDRALLLSQMPAVRSPNADRHPPCASARS